MWAGGRKAENGKRAAGIFRESFPRRRWRYFRDKFVKDECEIRDVLARINFVRIYYDLHAGLDPLVRQESWNLLFISPVNSFIPDDQHTHTFKWRA